MPSGVWIHYVIIHAGRNYVILRSGILDAKFTSAGFTFMMSSVGAGSAGTLNGALDELRIFSRALNESDARSAASSNRGVTSRTAVMSAASAVGVSILIRHGLGQRQAASGDGSLNTLLALGLLGLPATVYWGYSGMEHPFFTLVVTATLVSGLADDRRRAISPTTAVLLTIALATRPEGVLLAIWIAFFFTIGYGQLDVHWLCYVAAPIGVVATVLGLMLSLRFAYFGSFVPNTYYAKVVPNTWDRFGAGASYLGRCLLIHAPLLLVASLLYGVASKRSIAPKRPTAFLAGWISLWSVYVASVGGDHFAMFRFFMPALPAAILLIGLLWESVQPHVAPVWTPRSRGGGARRCLSPDERV